MEEERWMEKSTRNENMKDAEDERVRYDERAYQSETKGPKRGC
jgi:hypothetical protein